MLDVQQLPPRMFILEGIFLGCLGKKIYKPKSIILEVEQEQLVIKLPKELRASLHEYRLQPGSRIRCIGRSQVDFKAGAIKLKAYQIFPLSPPDEDTPPPVTPQTPISTIVASPRVSSGHRPVSAGQKRAKVLVCRKSGCQKRGGRQLVSTLEKLLQEHQLQDQVEIQYTGCQKRCSKAPTVTIMPGKYRYDRLNPQNLSTLVEQHFCRSEPSSIPDQL